MTGLDAPSEDDSDRDGFLSYAAEWHSLSHGLYDGLRSIKTMPTNADVQKEPHYYKGAYVIGTLLQLLVGAFLAGTGLGMF